MKRLCFFLFLLVPFLGYSQEYKALNNEAAVWAKLKDAAKNTRTMQADVYQVKSLDFMDEPLVSTGRFYYKQDNKLRWEYHKPLDYLMLINGSQVRVKEKGKEIKSNDAIDQVFKEIRELMMGCVSGDIFTNPAYSPQLTGNGVFYRVSLVPKEKEIKRFVSKIELYLDVKTSELTRIVMTDPAGDTTDMQFRNRKVNKPIDDKLFTQF